MTGTQAAPSGTGWLESIKAWIRTLGLRRRVGLLAGLGVGFVVVVVAITAYVTVRGSLLYQLDTTLMERAREAAGGETLTNPRVITEVPAEAVGAGDVQIALLFASADAFSAEGPASAPPLGAPELAVARGESDISIRTALDHDEGQSFRVVAVPVPGERGQAFVMGQSMLSYEKLLSRLGLVLLIVGGAGIVMAAWSGFEIARTGLRPVQRLTYATERVARTGDLRPIPVSGNDELARLTASFNTMLGALAAARVRERRLIADAGHELRTPLTSLRTNLDLLVQSEDRPGLSPEDRVALLDDVRAQLNELSALVGDLVELAREDPQPAAKIRLDLAEVAGRALERVQRRAPGVDFQVRLESWSMVGDPQPLERAVTNLLDNAAKWSPPNGVVTLRLNGGVLTVTDQGPGISDADLPHVFERFYRSAEARTQPGSGLGLAIVRQAVDRHGGTVYAGRAPDGGASFTARFPGLSRSR